MPLTTTYLVQYTQTGTTHEFKPTITKVLVSEYHTDIDAAIACCRALMDKEAEDSHAYRRYSPPAEQMKAKLLSTQEFNFRLFSRLIDLFPKYV